MRFGGKVNKSKGRSITGGKPFPRCDGRGLFKGKPLTPPPPSLCPNPPFPPSQVCELDIIFNFEKAYFILDEFLMGGEIQDTSKKSVLKAIEQADLLQEVCSPSLSSLSLLSLLSPPFSFYLLSSLSLPFPVSLSVCCLHLSLLYTTILCTV